MVLVLWVLSLAALLVFLATALDLGDRGQGVVNTQDAADSAALGAAAQLGSELPLSIYASVSACDSGGPPSGSGLGACPCPPDLSLGCRNGDYSWLNGYYIYVQDQGWLGIPQGISGGQAFAYGLQEGWSCSATWHRRRSPERCLEVSTNVAGSDPGALTDDGTVAKLTIAVQSAESLAQAYYPAGQGPDWSACTSLPVGFSIAQKGNACVGYEASPGAYDYWAPAAPSEYLLLWVEVVSPLSSSVGSGPSEVRRDAYAVWAPSTSGGDGPAPWAPLGPSQLPGLAHLCSLAASTCP